MQLSKGKSQRGNVLLCVLGTILVVSLIGGNVLLNCVTRFNASSSQVRCWKEALYAAEAGGDVAYAEVRKKILDSSHAFNGWDYTGGVYSNSPITFGRDNLTTSSQVDSFYYDFSGNPWYRIRVKGTAPLRGLNRVTMDDRMGVGTRGDSLLRKIDFQFDHFIAAYGPNGNNVGKAIVPVSQAKVTRRVELIAAPMTPFEAAIKAAGTAFDQPPDPTTRPLKPIPLTPDMPTRKPAQWRSTAPLRRFRALSTGIFIRTVEVSPKRRPALWESSTTMFPFPWIHFKCRSRTRGIMCLLLPW